MGVSTAIKGSLTLLRNTVLVRNLESGERKSQGGIVVLDDNMKDIGIRSRWAEVYKVGPEVTDLAPGEWILIKHGRWTYSFDVEETEGEVVKLWRVEYPDSVELVSDTFPSELKPTDFQ